VKLSKDVGLAAVEIITPIVHCGCSELREKNALPSGNAVRLLAESYPSQNVGSLGSTKGPRGGGN